MKSKIVISLLCFVMIIASAFGHNDSFLRINPEHITKAQNTIKNEIRYHFWYKIAAGTGIAAALGVSIYLFILANKTPVIPPTNVGYLTEGDVLNLRSLLNKYVVEENKTLAFNSGPFGWIKQQFILNTQTILIGVAATGIFSFMNNSLGPISKYLTRLDGFLDRSVSNFFHKNNMQWFIANHVNLLGVYKLLLENAEIIEGRPIQIPANLLTDMPTTVSGVVAGSQAHKDAMDALQGYWNKFVQELELVLGFIEYKRTINTNSETQKIMHVISNKIVNLVNNSALDLEKKSISIRNNNSKQTFCNDLLNLRASIGQELSNFSLLESFKRYDFLNETVKK